MARDDPAGKIPVAHCLRRALATRDAAKTAPARRTGWPGAESAVQITRENRHVPAGHERANAAFEFLKFAGGGASSFGKNDQDIAGIRQELTANCETLTDVRLARERQRVYNHGRDPGARHALEKIIRCGRRKCAMQSAQRQACEQTDNIEMTRMIGDEHERTVAPQMFLSDDFEAAIGAQERSDDERDQ